MRVPVSAVSAAGPCPGPRYCHAAPRRLASLDAGIARLTDRERRQPANAVLARQIGTAIVRGDYAPGVTLPGELELADSTGVARSVVREALRTLSAKGLIESRRKAGTRVRARAEWNLLDPELLRWVFEGAPPLDFVRDLFELRLIVEPGAAEVAARQRTPSQLSRMGHALETMVERGLKTEDGQAADQQFHAVLLEATHNQLIVSLSATIAAAVRWTTYFKYQRQRHPRDPMPQHRVLFEAIAEGRGGAARDAAAALIRQALEDTEASLIA